MADELRSRRPTVAEQLARELSDIADIADELGLLDDPVAAPETESVYDYLDTTRWSLADCVLRGERTRRLVNAPNRLVDVAVAEHADRALDRAAGLLRDRADDLAEQVRLTNTVVARWLVAHRVAIVNPCYLDSNALYDRYRYGDLDPEAVSDDPLYLLVCHLHDVLEAGGEWDGGDSPALQHLRAQLTLPMRAVRHEMVAAMAHHAAAIGVTRTLSRLEAR
ncbi:hypothetical protein [Mycolicibacterium arenosum]|uniref:Uncharacterized protein n=1 Tax=Mycolicibacterium arenosum TaxID=2952157 RepID=A0ABT1M5H0_9MYCO|nr:hypothetical protein [Mycolicibacterium sp. CAU 1645]MCP9273042.1 hypothetical protein [Mycolicibacterium sp. CAU 1645]